MRKRALWTVLVAVAAVAGCDGSGTKGQQYEEDAYPPGFDVVGETPDAACLSQNVWAPPEFDWRLTGEVQLEIAVVQLDGSPWPDVVVSVYDDASDLPGNQNLIAKGQTDADGLWTGAALLPSGQEAVTIVVNIMGAKNWDRIPVSDGRVVVEFGRED